MASLRWSTNRFTAATASEDGAAMGRGFARGARASEDVRNGGGVRTARGVRPGKCLSRPGLAKAAKGLIMSALRNPSRTSPLTPGGVAAGPSDEPQLRRLAHPQPLAPCPRPVEAAGAV